MSEPVAIPPAILAAEAVKLPLKRLRRAQAAYDAAERKLADARVDAIEQLRSQGLSYAQIGQLVGLHKSRVFQVLAQAQAEAG